MCNKCRQCLGKTPGKNSFLEHKRGSNHTCLCMCKFILDFMYVDDNVGESTATYGNEIACSRHIQVLFIVYMGVYILSGEHSFRVAAAPATAAAVAATAAAVAANTATTAATADPAAATVAAAA
eukprot:scpid106782/ scgid28346/ 